jgi:phosphate transport system substrate-binding protein
MFGASGKRNHAGGSISTWGQAGLKDGWNRQPIHLYGRGKKSGTRDFFKHVALLDGELKPEVQEQPGSASEVLAVAQDPLAIGYASTGYQTSFVRMVPLAERAGARFVMPSEESVKDGSYPLARPLYLYIHKNPKEKLEPVVAEFLNFINSRQGQEAVARSNFYPLSGMQIAKNREQLGQSDVVALEISK